MKAVHREFFPLFALIESPMHAVGVKVVAQRKLLYLEKMVASLLLATPKIKLQLNNRIIDLRQQLGEGLGEADCQRTKRLLFLLEGLNSLLLFFLCVLEERGRKPSKFVRMFWLS